MCLGAVAKGYLNIMQFNSIPMKLQDTCKLHVYRNCKVLACTMLTLVH